MSKILIIAVVIVIVFLSFLFNRKKNESIQNAQNHTNKEDRKPVIEHHVEVYHPELVSVGEEILDFNDVDERLEDMITERFIDKYIESYKAFCDYKVDSYTKLMGRLSSSNGEGPDNMVDGKLIAKQRIETWKVNKQSFDTSTATKNIELILYARESGIMHLRETRPMISKMLEDMFKSFVMTPKVYCYHGNNMLLLGANGIGKTTAAEIIALALYNMGITLKSTKQDLDVTESGSSYKDGSELNLRNAYVSNMGGVIFIDEFYTFAGDLVQGKRRKASTLGALLTLTSKFEGIVYTIGAGYEDMIVEDLFSANEGTERRFNKIVYMMSQTDEILTKILCKNMTKTYDIEITKEQASIIYSVLKRCKEARPDRFKSNAGDMENISCHFSRCITPDSINWGETRKQDIQIINTMFDLHVNNRRHVL